MKVKLYKFFIAGFMLVISSCNITEQPVFFAAETLFSDSEGANTVLNGAYSTIADWSNLSGMYPQIVMGCSGYFGIEATVYRENVGKLAPYPSLSLLNSYWKGVYKTVGKINDLITGMSDAELSNLDEKNNILGQAYFLRSWSYFYLVNIWGDVPLLTEMVTTSNANLPKSSVAEIYAQIISDAEKAKELLPEASTQKTGRPGKEAANMLMAKVYMTMAGNQTASESEYWAKAKEEAIQAYNKYTLVNDYRTMWYEESSDNTSESIFEIQGSEENTFRWEQIFSAKYSNLGRNMYGRLFINIEAYDSHKNRYPEDPRISSTFATSYSRYNTNGTSSTYTTYPIYKSRGNRDRSFPFSFKWFIKDGSSLNYNTNQNLVVYRYADLLLMLAEIENEINGPANAYQYVNEVLARARQSADVQSNDPADWGNMTQEEFREAIMNEYSYELLGEGQEWFYSRRRGYEYFKTHVIDPHNNHPKYNFDKVFDNIYEDNSRIMLLPIPLSEISANPNISDSDQNIGY